MVLGGVITNHCNRNRLFHYIRSNRKKRNLGCAKQVCGSLQIATSQKSKNHVQEKRNEFKLPYLGIEK